MKPVLTTVVLSLSLLLGACSSVYYGAMEKVGKAKRDILVTRVEKARDAQTEAKEQFQDALEQFLALTRVEPGEIKRVYDKLNSELKDCENRAQEVGKRIDAIEDVAEALFDEWQRETRQISDARDRRQSEDLLRKTRERSTSLVRTMRTAEAKMEPVLTKFRDKVLVLKHNLNAQAVAGLAGTATALEADVGRLVADMEKSIREAEVFLAGLES